LKAVGNVLWLILGGIWLTIGYVVAGIIQFVTIIGIPFGVASFKLARLALAPFGKEVVSAGAPLPTGFERLPRRLTTTPLPRPHGSPLRGGRWTSEPRTTTSLGVVRDSERPDVRDAGSTSHG
jgi:hypothetical protein